MQLTTRQTAKAGVRIGASAPARVVRVCALRGHHDHNQIASAVASFGLAAVLLVGAGPVHAEKAPLLEAELEREYAVDQQKQQMDYLMQQQENAVKAQLLAQRKAVEAQIGSVEGLLQNKITATAASVKGAEQKGDARLASAIERQKMELEEKAAQVRKAAAQIESKLDRVEMLQRAKAIAEKQQLDRVVKAEKEDISASVDKIIRS